VSGVDAVAAQVADRIALQDVMERYAAGVDERDFDLYTSVFSEDVEVLGFGAETVHGREAWVAYVRDALERFGPTQHLMGPQQAEVEGDIAHCRTNVQAMHFLKDPAGEILTLWACYESDMRRTPEGWKIIRHRLVPRGTKQG
jgi:ketosteroid isomerase-like protein